MKKFEDELKEKAHLSKIRQAKKTIVSSAKTASRLSSSKVGAEAQLLLQLYENKSYSSIPAYKLLRTANLQQYTKGFIVRGYGINLSRLVLLSEEQRKGFYEQIKVMPGHAVKLDRIIDAVARSSCWATEELSLGDYPPAPPSKPSIRDLREGEAEYERELEKVQSEYTPDQKKKTAHELNKSEERGNNGITSSDGKQFKTKNSISRPLDFKKKSMQEPPSSKPTVKKTQTQEGFKKELISKISKRSPPFPASMSPQQTIELTLDLDKARALDRSFDGALMSSTIANIDIEELVYAFAGFVSAQIMAAEPQLGREEKEEEGDIEEEVAQILRESYMHPLYQENVEEDIECQETISEGEGEEQLLEELEMETRPARSNEFSFDNEAMMESSFLGGQSVHFGLRNPLSIFEEPCPTEIDYFKPTSDSISNFIKNVVLTAKMEREIPIMAAVYLAAFLTNSRLQITSLNYKRLLVTVLLLSSKIWDDESFESPSFSKTFPEYSTVLLNEMQKQVVNLLDYKLKVDKREYTKMYFQLRQFIKGSAKSYHNRKMPLKRIRELQLGLRSQFKTQYLAKRNSF